MLPAFLVITTNKLTCLFIPGVTCTWPRPLGGASRADPVGGDAVDDKRHPRAEISQPVHPMRNRLATKFLQQ